MGERMIAGQRAIADTKRLERDERADTGEKTQVEHWRNYHSAFNTAKVVTRLLDPKHHGWRSSAVHR